MGNEIKKKSRFREYLPDFLIIFGVFWITGIKLSNSTYSTYIGSNRYTHPYPPEDVLLYSIAIVIVSVGVDILVRRYLKSRNK